MEKRILVVDNDDEMGDLFREIFNDDSYTIIFHEDTDDVVELIKTHEPHVVVLDYNLNGINGGELCKQIKGNAELSNTPVILFSGFPKAIYAAANYGYDAFVEKPFDIDELKETVDEQIGRSF